MFRFQNPAIKRYTWRIFCLMSAYMIALFGVRWLFDHHPVTGAAAYALAIVPALPIIGVFVAVMRLIMEMEDEYLRMLLVRQCLFATGFCLVVVTIWQFLQNFELLPPGNGGFGAAFFWFMGLGLGAIYNRLTWDAPGKEA